MTVRVLVCEYITGGGLADQPLPESLAREGDLMLSALIRDLSDLPDVECVATRDPRLDVPALEARFIFPVEGENIFDLWANLAGDADAVWPIAPETDGCLERLTFLVQSRNRMLLGSRPDAVRIATSKHATAAVLARHGLPVVRTVSAAMPLPISPFGWVVKPDDGVGAEDMMFFAEPEPLLEYLAGRDHIERLVVQPHIPGTAASLCVLFRDGTASVLSCNRQDIVVDDGRMSYRGGVIGAMEDFRAALAPIAQGVAEALPGLWGYAGIDLVVTDEGPVIIEVNPRLTTSYVGLREAIRLNPAGLVLDLARHGKLASVAPARTVRVALEARVG